MKRCLGQLLSPRPALLGALRSHSDQSYYVRKVRALETLRTDDGAMRSDFAKARFVAFLDGRPLVRVAEGGDSLSYRLLTLSGEELTPALQRHDRRLDVADTALLDIAPRQTGWEDAGIAWSPLLALDLGRSSKGRGWEGDLGRSLAKKLGGVWADPRWAVMGMAEEAEAGLLTRGLVCLRWARAFRHCPGCGAEVKRALSKASARCGECSAAFYPPYSPVAIVLVRDAADSRLLLVRPPIAVRSVWTCVAGFAEAGEPLEETARREVAEEVGVELASLAYAQRSQAWPFPSGSLMCGFVATAAPESRLDPLLSEVKDAAWFTRQEVREAFDRTARDPAAAARREAEGGDDHRIGYVPPKGTMAHILIDAWLRGHL